MTGLIVDLFAGPGGWSVGLNMLGLEDIGVEWDRAACLTRRAAGHLTVRADVSQYPPEAFRGCTGLIASPPCPDFSTAGTGAGRAGKSGWLVDVPLRWVDLLRPEWVAFEQVPPVLPIWQEQAHTLRSWGYSVWCGVLNSADYGVPQTRKRAILLASRVGAAVPPSPTHARNPEPDLFGPGLAPWVTMADALGWHGTVDRRQQTDGVPVRLVPTSEPAPCLTGIAGAKSQWVVDRCRYDGWVYRQDAQERAGRRRPLLEPAPTIKGTNGATESGFYAPDDTRPSVRLTIEEATTLQSFPDGYPWRGSRTSQFTQVGNAVPPLLAAHLIGALTGRTVPTLETVA